MRKLPFTVLTRAAMAGGVAIAHALTTPVVANSCSGVALCDVTPATPRLHVDASF